MKFYFFIKNSLGQRPNPQFCVLHFDFCILKLTIGQFELDTNRPATDGWAEKHNGV